MGACAGGTTWGLDWAKILNKEQVDKVLETVEAKHPEVYRVILTTSARTGLRVCEVGHLKVEDLLPGNRLRITRRKKKVLKSEVIEIFPTLHAMLTDWCKEKTGWMFPGHARPCIIHRRPVFEETACPDCGRPLVNLRLIRKKCDRVMIFTSHLVGEHKRTPDEVEEWIGIVSRDVDEPFCNGGHLSIRSIQRRFEIVIADAGLRLHGRGIHTLRHAFAVQVYAKTKDLRKTQQMLGHEQVTTTTRYATCIDIGDTLKELDGSM